MSARDLMRLLLASLGQGPAIHQQLLLLAIGHASPEHYPLLLEELPLLMDEYMKPGKGQKRQGRPDEVRMQL